MGQRLEVLERRAARAAWEYQQAKEELDDITEKANQFKATFKEAMMEYTDAAKSKKVVFDDVDGTFLPEHLAGASLVVNRVEKTSIEWDADKLAKRVDKSIANKIIRKQYRIADMRGLIEYLKECGVDPKVFKKFIIVDRTVDEQAIDRLGDTGELSTNAISGCYTVKCQKPYFTMSVKKYGDNDDQW